MLPGRLGRDGRCTTQGRQCAIVRLDPRSGSYPLRATMAHCEPPERSTVRGLGSGVRARVKLELRRRGVEVAVPRCQEPAKLRHARVRRFHLPPTMAATEGAVGPDTYLVDLDRVVNRARFRYGPGAWHPFVAALAEQQDRPGLPYTESVLARFYERFQPETVHDVLLGERAPRGVVACWPAVDQLLDVWSVTDRRVQRVEARLAAVATRWPSQFLGPNVVIHGRDHLERILQTHRSIRDSGYRPGDFADGVPTGYLLVDGEDYRVVVGHGNHRMAALTALGVERVPIRLRLPHPPVIAREDLRRWTVSGGGLYSDEEATALFDSYFADDGLERARALGLA
jgi:hypothetical protein